MPSTTTKQPSTAGGGLIPVEDALHSFLALATLPLKKVQVPLMQSIGKVLATDVISHINVPPADNSAMDGYAFRLADVRATSSEYSEPMAVSQRIAAGTAPLTLEPGTAARIFTGGQIPNGADSVIMQENCEADAGHVRFSCLPSTPGANIRRAGEDIQEGSRVLSAGSTLRPQDLGLLASVGQDTVTVFEPLRVAVLSTGTELAQPGSPLKEGTLYNSNQPMLLAMLTNLGLTAIDAGTCNDSFDETKEALRQAAQQADIVITSGGVSVGEEDHVKAAVSALGGISLWKVAIKPGKPFAFGQIGSTPFIGLPGNPASVFTTFLMLARPFLLACQGCQSSHVSPVKVPAGFSRAPVSRQEYVRVRLVDGRLVPFSNQGSGVLTSASWADGFAIHYVGSAITEGEPLDYLAFDSLMNR